MRRPSVRSRAVAALATLAVAAAGAIAMAPPASAADIDASLELPDGGAPAAVYTNLSNQPATDWIIHFNANVSSGDTLKLELDDSDDPDANCTPAADSVVFGATPSIAIVAPATGTFTVTPSESVGDCPANDILTITATSPIASGSEARLSGITYSVGVDADPGPIRYSLNDAAFTSTNTNAVISEVRVASSDAARLITTGAGADQALGDIVLQEQSTGAITADGACIRLLGPAGTEFDHSPEPTNTASGGNGAVGNGVVSGDADDLDFTIQTPSDSGTTRYTLSNVRVDPGATPGPIDAIVGTDCGDTNFSPRVRLGFVGTTDRISGSNRYATAALISDQQFDCLAGKTVVLARGDAFPDALAAAYLAGKNQVPILLTATNSIPPETLAAIETQGVTNLVIIGGTQAISQAVEDFLKNKNSTTCGGVATNTKLLVDRIFGADRYQTAKNVAERPGLGAAGTFDDLNAAGACSPKKTAIVASGENFPDALAAGGLAYSGAAAGGCGSGGLPLLLTNQGSLNSHAAGAIGDLGIEQVILLGGTTAVAAGVETAIDNLPNVSVMRVAGEAPNTNRQGTAIAIANRLLGVEDVGGEWNADRFLLSRPDNFPDALTASALSGLNEAPLYLAESTGNLGSAATSGIVSYWVQYHRGTLLGGTEALAPAVDTQTRAAIAGQPSE